MAAEDIDQNNDTVTNDVRKNKNTVKNDLRKENNLLFSSSACSQVDLKNSGSATYTLSRG